MKVPESPGPATARGNGQGNPPTPAPPQATQRRRFGFILLTILAILIFGLLLGEAVVRRQMPYLLPKRSDYDRETGLAIRTVDLKLNAIKQQPPDYVLIGDSHVETGGIPGGWISSLNEMTGKKFADFGVAGSCPSQYFILLERLRKEGISAPAIMLIYVGNDFFDEGLWASLGPDKSGYLEARGNALKNPASRQFWPCMDDRFSLGAWLADHSALYRAFFFAKYKLQSKLARDQPAPTPEENETMLNKLMNARCDKPPHSERIGGRLFFFDQHEAQIDPREPYVGDGIHRVRELILSRCKEQNLRILLVATREETSVKFHHREVTRIQPFIDEMKVVCPAILDPNAAFVEAAVTTDLFLPDSHFNIAGGRLLASEIKRALGL